MRVGLPYDLLRLGPCSEDLWNALSLKPSIHFILLSPSATQRTPVEPPQGRFSASRPQSTSAEPKPSERIEWITTAHRTLPSSSHPVAVALLVFGRAALPSPCLHTAGPGQVVPSDQTTKSIITNNEHLPSLWCCLVCSQCSACLLIQADVLLASTDLCY